MRNLATRCLVTARNERDLLVGFEFAGEGRDLPGSGHLREHVGFLTLQSKLAECLLRVIDVNGRAGGSPATWVMETKSAHTALWGTQAS